ncbi:MAG: CocE/NonD family hydrolase [Bryobacteraceae bacterium]|nr:CocE/NonD family hydrolase [Bryobacteraceae bacterium]
MSCPLPFLLVLLPLAAQATLLHVKVPMRDGVRLCTSVFQSAARRGPVVLIRTPYGKPDSIAGNYKAFVDLGFTLVIQDVRGRHHSAGRFTPPLQERNDGDDTLNWIATQPWSDGNIAMTGGSYLGISQWHAALSQNKHLKAVFPVVAGSDDYLDRFYSPGGAFKAGHRLQWMTENVRAPNFVPVPFSRFVFHLPMRTADRAATGHAVDFYQRALDHPTYDAYWKGLSVRQRIPSLRIPFFIVGGWYDNYVQSDLEAFTALARQSPDHRIVIGPWPHNMSYRFTEFDFGPASGAPIRRYQVEWFDRWLRGREPPFNSPPVRLFVMGINQWRDENEWPLSRAVPTPFYLDSGGNANSLSGDGVLRARPPRRAGEDEFTYDPRNPVPTRGGAVCCNPTVFPWGPMDQRPVEARRDVLVFSTEPLRADLEVTGPIRVVLHIATTVPDTDFTAKLVDVFPDGRAMNLTDGILRLRYRHSLAKAEPATPGKAYAITIDAGVTSNVFRAGHRIRLEISSSNFPRFDRNPNTGRLISEETTLRTALQTVFHGPLRPSHVLLPVVPAAPEPSLTTSAANR